MLPAFHHAFTKRWFHHLRTPPPYPAAALLRAHTPARFATTAPLPAGPNLLCNLPRWTVVHHHAAFGLPYHCQRHHYVSAATCSRACASFLLGSGSVTRRLPDINAFGGTTCLAPRADAATFVPTLNATPFLQRGFSYIYWVRTAALRLYIPAFKHSCCGTLKHGTKAQAFTVQDKDWTHTVLQAPILAFPAISLGPWWDMVPGYHCRHLPHHPCLPTRTHLTPTGGTPWTAWTPVV